MRVLAVGAAPAMTFFVLGWWASYRGQAAVQEQLNHLNHTRNSAIESPFAVALLLVSMAVTVIVLEILVYNPYQADLKRAVRAQARVRKEIRARRDRAAKAVDAHAITWGDLRSARDEVIAFVHAELARPWQTVILPARLRHGRAGPTSAETKHSVNIELMPGDGTAGTEQVQITYQVFAGMVQPQPAPGPLAEVVRTVIELDPDKLRARQRQLEQALRAQFGGLAPPDSAAPPDEPGPGRNGQEA
jgi:hypothetical protein